MTYSNEKAIRCRGDTYEKFSALRRSAGMSENKFILYIIDRMSPMCESRRER
jgi:hypothetical protein